MPDMEITNEKALKLTMSDVYGVGVDDYEALSNRPKINGVEVSGNKTLADYGITTATNYEDLSDKPKINDTEVSGSKSLDDYGIASKADASAAKSAIDAHVSNTGNPHNVTAEQLGLGGVAKQLDELKASDSKKIWTLNSSDDFSSESFNFGDLVITKYFTGTLGKGSIYRISDSGAANSIDCFMTADGKYAVKQYAPSTCVEELGCIGDNADNTLVLKYIYQNQIDTVFVFSDTYQFTQVITQTVPVSSVFTSTGFLSYSGDSTSDYAFTYDQKSGAYLYSTSDYAIKCNSKSNGFHVTSNGYSGTINTLFVENPATIGITCDASTRIFYACVRSYSAAYQTGITLAVDCYISYVLVQNAINSVSVGGNNYIGFIHAWPSSAESRDGSVLTATSGAASRIGCIYNDGISYTITIPVKYAALNVDSIQLRSTAIVSCKLFDVKVDYVPSNTTCKVGIINEAYSNLSIGQITASRASSKIAIESDIELGSLTDISTLYLLPAGTYLFNTADTLNGLPAGNWELHLSNAPFGRRALFRYSNRNSPSSLIMYQAYFISSTDATWTATKISG